MRVCVCARAWVWTFEKIFREGEKKQEEIKISGWEKTHGKKKNKKIYFHVQRDGNSENSNN